ARANSDLTRHTEASLAMPTSGRHGFAGASVCAAGPARCRSDRQSRPMESAAVRARVEEHVRRHELIPPGGDVLCLVSGGAVSTCLWHVRSALGYRVAALHVNHRLRGDESDADARFCSDRLGAEVIELDGRGLSEADLRAQRYSVATGRLRATGHTASD